MGAGQKRAAVSGGFEVDNREASNRVDRSHSVSKRGQSSHSWESLIDRKRAIFFKFPLPCRPLAYIRRRSRRRSPRQRDGLRLEEAVGGILGGALLVHRRLQPLDFRIHQRNALAKFLHRKQRDVLSDLVTDFLARLV